MSLADAIGWIANVPLLVGLYYGLLVGMRRRVELKSTSYAWYAAGWWLGFISSVMDTSPPWTAITGLIAAIYTWLWWKNRRKGRGRRALRELGDKSRRRVAALVEQMTPSPIPSPAGA